jgi:uncharacterized membrane protein
MSEPSVPPTPPPPPEQPPAASADSNRTVMLVLAYLWIFAIIPLLVEKEDREVQWHAKHGLVLLVAEIILWIALSIVSMIPVVGCVISIGFIFLPLVALVLRVLMIVKAINNERFLIPGLSEFADKF